MKLEMQRKASMLFEETTNLFVLELTPGKNTTAAGCGKAAISIPF